MSETDREMLELAAKAAGEWPSPEPFQHVLDRWNPINDDSDALRLAVKCGISVLQFPTCIGTRWPQSGINPPYEEITSEQDALVATRRAIVRAAAEIGRNMK